MVVFGGFGGHGWRLPQAARCRKRGDDADLLGRGPREDAAEAVAAVAMRRLEVTALRRPQSVVAAETPRRAADHTVVLRDIKPILAPLPHLAAQTDPSLYLFSSS